MNVTIVKGRKGEKRDSVHNGKEASDRETIPFFDRSINDFNKEKASHQIVDVEYYGYMNV